MRQLLYNLTRHHWSGAPLSRWLAFLLLLGGLVTGIGWLPGGWPVAALWLLAFLTLLGMMVYWRRRDFVRFQEAPAPELIPARLDPSDKIPIFATGHFSVEGKYRRFTWLQGFFRTFATREHAVICHVPPRRFLLGQWPERETGLWYQFFMPGDIQQVRWGVIDFGAKPMVGLAVEYRLTIPKRSRLSRARTLDETVFLACHTEEDARRILANLLYELTPPPAMPPTAGTRPERLNGRVRQAQTREK